VIRALEYEDLEHLWRWQNDLTVMAQMWIEPTSLRALQKEYEDELGNKRSKRFLIAEKATGQPTGVVWYYSMTPNSSCEVGIYIGDPKLHGKGYGSDALLTFLRFLFNVKNMHRVGLSVSSNNQQAIASYRKCGFKHEGATREFAYIDGQYVDLVNMGILKTEFQELD